MVPSVSGFPAERLFLWLPRNAVTRRIPDRKIRSQVCAAGVGSGGGGCHPAHSDCSQIQYLPTRCPTGNSRIRNCKCVNIALFIDVTMIPMHMLSRLGLR